MIGLSPETYRGADGSSAGHRHVPAQERTRICSVVAELIVVQRWHERLGVPMRALVFGAWANAWGESGFDVGAWRQEPDGRTSYGLFQCLVGTAMKRGGAGDGHSPASLIDPVYNTGVILGEALTAARSHGPPSDVIGLTDWWVRYVERPENPTVATDKRVGWLRSWGGA